MTNEEKMKAEIDSLKGVVTKLIAFLAVELGSEAAKGLIREVNEI